MNAKKYLSFSNEFVDGFSKGISLMPINTYRVASNEESRKKDYLALRGDWINVGRDIKKETAAYASTR